MFPCASLNDLIWICYVQITDCACMATIYHSSTTFNDKTAVYSISVCVLMRFYYGKNIYFSSVRIIGCIALNFGFD